MTLKLYSHPLSAFCQKVLVALYENDTPFEAVRVDFGEAASRKAFLELWPMGKIPVLVDEARDWQVAETPIIIEYLAQHYPGPVKLVPSDPDKARQTRFRERFFDLYVAVPMQKIVMDRHRPEGSHDRFGVEEARKTLKTALDMIEEDVGSKTWAMGEDFTAADCAAAPALWYANWVMPFGDTHKKTMAYFERLKARPSFARAAKEAEPYHANFPRE
jgi:glutathione S-transferase